MPGQPGDLIALWERLAVHLTALALFGGLVALVVAVIVHELS
jgi:hypothetical protein